MMQMKYSIQKMLIPFITIVILAGSLCGCGAISDIPSTNEAKETEKIEFAWWGNDPRHIYTMEGVDFFMNENPDIQVDLSYGIWNGYETRNKVFMNSHTEPDVMQINYGWLAQYSPDGDGYYDLYQLTDYIDLSGYSDSDLSFGEVNGKLNALPIAYNSTVIFYNQDLFEQYGLEIPKTWDDLFIAADKMKADHIYPIGAVKKHVFMLMIAYYEQNMNKSVFDDDGKCLLDKDDVVYMLEFYKHLIDEKVLMPIEQFDRGLLASGELAGSVFWISDISNYCASIESAGKPVLGPYLKIMPSDSIHGWYKKPATMYAIGKGTNSPGAAGRLLDFLVNNPHMATLQGTEKGIPVSKYALSAVEDEGLLTGYSVEANAQMMAADDSLRVMLPVMEDEEIIDAFKSGADLYIYDKASVEEAAESIMAVLYK